MSPGLVIARRERGRGLGARGRLALAGAACLAGCVVVPVGGRGDLVVDYVFDGYDCGGAGVVDVEVDVAGQSMGASRAATASCEPGWMALADLPADRYDVLIRGFDGDGLVLYQGEFKVDVFADAENETQLSIPAARADLTLGWTFPGGSECLDVARVWVRARDPFDALYDDAVYPCSAHAVVYPGVITGSWLMTLEAEDESGALLYAAYDAPVQVDAESTNDVVVELN